MLDVWLRTEWLSCRKNSVLRCVERYSAAAASEYRRALRKVQEVEETMVQGEVEALNPPHRRRKSSHPPLNKRTGSPPPPSISFRWTSYINWKP